MSNRKKSPVETYQDIPRRMKKLFGVSWIPSIPFDRSHWPEEVRKVAGKMSLSGVQQKASVILNKKSKEIELAQGNGMYILKPDPPEYLELSKIESLCMDLAESMGMDVPPHGVLSLADGTPAYIVKRFDRNSDGSKIHKEDMAQILEFPTDAKYGSSLEKVGKAIFAHTSNAYLDLTSFFERVVFNFAIGNGDMHLKNWALLMQTSIGLAPCYDFVSSRLYIPNEDESALTINGKRNKLVLSDFEALATHLGIDQIAMRNVFEDLISSGKTTMLDMIKASDTSDEKKDALIKIFSDRMNLIGAKALSS